MILKEYLISECIKQYFGKINNFDSLDVEALKDNSGVIASGIKIKFIVEGLCKGAGIDPNLEYSPSSDQIVSDLLLRSLRGEWNADI